jgi:uncharacterized protein YqeY
MLRESLSEALKTSQKAKEARKVATLRLILAALKDRDIAARGEGNDKGVPDDDILSMLATMVRQRHESIKFYVEGAREELAQQEREEIDIIREFMPRQLDDDEVAASVVEVIKAVSAEGLKDMGRTMAELRNRFAGQMDFGKASKIVKEQLS